MKIVIVSRYCAKPSWQGSAQHATSLAQELLRNNHEIIMISGEEVDMHVIIEQDGYLLHKIPLISRSKSFLDDFVIHAQLSEETFHLSLKILRDFNPDIVHFGAVGKLLSVVEAVNKLNIPSTAMVHDFFWISLRKFNINLDLLDDFVNHNIKIYKDESSYIRYFISILVNLNFFRFFIPNSIIKKFDYYHKIKNASFNLLRVRNLISLFIIQNPDNKYHLIKSGVSSQKITYVPQALIHEKLIKYPKTKLNTNKIKLGYIGRVDREKGLDILFKSLSKLKQKNYILHIISEGATKQKIKKITKINPNKFNLKLINHLKTPEDISRAIAELDVFICPSTWPEIGPRTVIEAIAQNVPCVVSNIIGNRFHIEDGINGRIFKNKDSDSLKRILKEILLNPKILTNWSKKLPKIQNEKNRTKKIIELHKKVLNK